MQSPLVTIIVPTYNRRNWIGECLDSIKSQTYTNYETLVIDDCSTDDTVEWLRSDPRFQFVQVHVQPKNGGASIARNDGIRMARGELIVFIDSDDALAPDHLQRAVKVFEKRPQTGLFCCDSTIIGPDSEVLFEGRTWHEIQHDLTGRPIHTGPRTLRDLFQYSHVFPGFTIPKAVFDRVGNFDQSIFPMDDYDLSLRIAGAGYEVYYCHEPLCLRREHTGQCSGFANSVDTCDKQIRALHASVERNPELRREASAEVRRRLARAKIELAVSRINAGESARGLGTLLDAVASDPSQLFRVARMSGRRLQRLVASA